MTHLTEGPAVKATLIRPLSKLFVNCSVREYKIEIHKYTYIYLLARVFQHCAEKPMLNIMRQSDFNHLLGLYTTYF